MAGVMKDWEARLILSLATNPGDERIGALVSEFGAVEALHLIENGTELASVQKRISTVRAPDLAERMLTQAHSCQARFITPESTEWPELLADLDFAMPIGLWCRGNVSINESRHGSLAIVGARASTAYGERMASELGTLAAQSGVVTISGAAYGIDAAAHRGSLAAGGVTFAVLACGVDVAYPAAHKGLLDRIASTGCIISERPLGQPAHKQHFLIRNRLIAAMAGSTVVVEAALRSGSLSTAHWAHNLGRQVWGIPGPISSATSAGVHAGIRDGNMSIVAELSDVLPKNADSQVTQGIFLEVNKAIVNHLAVIKGADGLTLGELCAHPSLSDYSQEHIASGLALLECYGHVVHSSQGWALA